MRKQSSGCPVHPQTEYCYSSALEQGVIDKPPDQQGPTRAKRHRNMYRQADENQQLSCQYKYNKDEGAMTLPETDVGINPCRDPGLRRFWEK